MVGELKIDFERRAVSVRRHRAAAHLRRVRAPRRPGPLAGPRPHPRDAARAGLGRLGLPRFAHDRRAHPPPAREARARPRARPSTCSRCVGSGIGSATKRHRALILGSVRNRLVAAFFGSPPRRSGPHPSGRASLQPQLLSSRATGRRTEARPELAAPARDSRRPVLRPAVRSPAVSGPGHVPGPPGGAHRVRGPAPGPAQAASGSPSPGLAADVDDNVALIRHQILIAGGIALLAALGRSPPAPTIRAEAAAERLAEGDFSATIPDQGGDEVGQLAATLNEMQERLGTAGHRPQGLHRQRLARAADADLLAGRLRGAAGRGGARSRRAGGVRADDARAGGAADQAHGRSARPLEARRRRDRVQGRAGRAGRDRGPGGERVRAGRRAPRLADRAPPATGRRGALADPDRVAQIMRILLDNALTHTPEGTSITITAQLQDQTASLFVKDDGPGVDPHERGPGLRSLPHRRPSERLRPRAGDRARAHPADGRRARGLSSHRGMTEFDAAAARPRREGTLG